ncbi:MAG: hypothetical protein RH862_07125 [Leptospiraceae bacterium]
MLRLFLLLLLEAASVFILYRISITSPTIEYEVREISGYIALGIHCLALLLALILGPRGGQDWSVSREKARANLIYLGIFPAFSGFCIYLASNQNMSLLGVSGALNAMLALFLLNWYRMDFQQADHQLKHNSLYGEFLPPAVTRSNGLLVKKFIEGTSLVLRGKADWERLAGFIFWILLSAGLAGILYLSENQSLSGWIIAVLPILVAILHYKDVWQLKIRLSANYLSIEDHTLITNQDTDTSISLIYVQGFRVAHETPGHYVWFHESKTHQYYRQHRIRIYAIMKKGADYGNLSMEGSEALVGDFHILSESSEEDANEAEYFINNALASINERLG